MFSSSKRDPEEAENNDNNDVFQDVEVDPPDIEGAEFDDIVPPPPSEPTNSNSSNNDEAATTHFAMAGYQIDIDNGMLPFMGILASSLILLIALLTPDYEMPNKNYGVTLSILSMICSMMGMYMLLNDKNKKELYHKTIGNNITVPILQTPLTVGIILSYFLFLWNFIGTCVLTFDAPFLIVGNGWVAAWAMVGFSFLILGLHSDAVVETIEHWGYSSSILMGASVIQLAAVIPRFTDDIPGQQGQLVYSLLMCVATIAFVIVVGFSHQSSSSTSSPTQGLATYEVVAFAILAFLWLLLACLVTFQGPFQAVGNGWFSAWAGFLCTILLLVRSLRPNNKKDETTNAANHKDEEDDTTTPPLEADHASESGVGL